MKIEIEKKELVNKLAKIAPAINNAILVYTNDEELIFEASNNEMNAQVSICKINKKITTCTLDQSFLKVISKMPEGVLVLDFKDNGLNLSCNDTKIKLVYLQIQNSQINFDYNEATVLNIPTFKQDIKKVLVSLSKERGILSGINFLTANDKLYIQATNRMSISQVIVENIKESVYKYVGNGEMVLSPLTKINLTIPGTTLQKILNAVDDEQFTFLYSNQRIMIKTASASWIIRVYDGNYPDINAVIPKEYSFEFELEKDLLLDVLERALMFQGDLIKLHITKSEIEISKVSEIGTITENLSIKSNIEKELLFGLSNTKLKDAIKHLTMPKIKVKGNNETSPIVIQENANSLQVVLPMRII